ncbi:MAG: M48 family metalloprotease [Deferrisomatales bacterium]
MGRSRIRRPAAAALLAVLGALWALALPGGTQASEARLRAHQLADPEVDPVDLEAEVRFGRELAARILGRYPLDPDPDLNRYVNLVGSAVAVYGPRSEIAYHFGVLASDRVNAYAAPGGYVFLTRGALAHMADEGELAAVLAHEIGHIDRRHIVEELHIRGSDAGAAAGLARLLGGVGDSAGVAFSQSVGAALEILFERGYRIEDEYEADAHAVELLVAAGYDPGALARYLERIRPLTEEGAALATHPPSAERVRRLRDRTAGANLRIPSAELLRRRFAEHLPRP